MICLILNLKLEIEVGNIKIDREKYLVYQDDNSFALPKKEFELLALLMSKPGKVFTREVILESFIRFHTNFVRQSWALQIKLSST